MKQAVVIDAVRLPIGRAHAERGYYREWRSEDLAVACIRALLTRNAFDPREIDDVVLGCASQLGEQGHNAARKIAIMAGLPLGSAACTVNRLCGSGLQALNQAVHSILAAAEDVQIVGGFEHMQHVPMDQLLDLSPTMFHLTSRAAAHMGITAEFLAQTQQISRCAQDAFAWESHRKACAALAAGSFQREIITTEIRTDTGDLQFTSRDQCMRADTSPEALAKLEPVFVPRTGTVTAGNSSPLNDGAATLLVMSQEKARDLQLSPLASIRATAVAGVEPCQMGIGPVPAIQKLLIRAKLSLSDIGLFEINEAFAAQALACIKMLDLPAEKVNVHGGAIALGHPLGASGARIATTLLHAMRTRGVRWGVAAMCIGFGQGIATLFELAE